MERASDLQSRVIKWELHIFLERKSRCIITLGPTKRSSTAGHSVEITSSSAEKELWETNYKHNTRNMMIKKPLYFFLQRERESGGRQESKISTISKRHELSLKFWQQSFTRLKVHKVSQSKVSGRTVVNVAIEFLELDLCLQIMQRNLTLAKML